VAKRKQEYIKFIHGKIIGFKAPMYLWWMPLIARLAANGAGQYGRNFTWPDRMSAF